MKVPQALCLQKKESKTKQTSKESILKKRPDQSRQQLCGFWSCDA
jgi:hypothetical protein